jgi:predicted ATPase/predicted Ser/Thr protein kinase
MERERWGQVDQIFHDALQVEESRRGELVRQLCAGDEDLRREVESLLAHHSESANFIETPAFADAGASPPRPRSSRSLDPTLNPTLNPQSGLADTVVGHYRVLGKIGCGGMGVVYEAEDLKLGRHVALKFLPEELAEDPESLQRFRLEARSASALNHPNICTVYEVDEANGRAFIAMELVEGKTLRELLASGSLPMRKAIEIGAQVAEGLTKAHEAGIAHRDLKPENLMVSDDGFVKILDFGLAKLASPCGEQSGITTSTTPGLVRGTVGYMSPEQASGDRLDFRSDQFSFGLVLYEMVTGKRAFQRSTAAETLVAILREPPEPITRQNRDAPAPLCWAIERCLAKEPDKRYVSTRDLARELATIRDRFSEKPVQQVEARPANLPLQRTGFVGREKEVTGVKELLLRQDVRLVTVTGPGGIGKTRLAVEVANGLVESFPGGTHFVSLSSLSDPGLIASVIVQTLGIREAGGQSPLEILKKNLQDSSRAPMLLLLDNFEHLVQAAPTVAELLAMGPNLKILVTSRAALHVYGEHEFPVPPLAMPDSRSMPPVEVLSQYPAVALFVQRAAAVKPDFELNRENASAVTEICARLDGLPLAIELAAARVKVLSPSSMLTRLASRLQLLTGGARDLPQRQQTLRAAIDWSYDLLDAAEQKLFRRLSVFVGGCTLEGAEAVCNTRGDLHLDLLDAMASMVDKSLAQQVEQAKGESRFAMLETIREYALEKLEASGEEALTKRAHAAYSLVLAEEEATEQSGAEGAEWLERFASEHDNFRAALEWLTETGDAEWGLRLGTALFRYWEIREYLAEGRDRLGRLLKLAAAAASTKLRMRALFAAGVLAGEQGDYASADALINESQDIARVLGDKTGIAVSLNALAVFARDRGDVATAHILFEASLGLWRELGDQKAVARALSNLANVLKLQGDYDRARSLYAECLAIFRGLEDRTGVAWSLNYQGDVARDQGDSAAAQALYEQGLVIFRELGDRWGIAGTLADLGSLAREQRNYPRVHSLYRESIRIFQELEHKRGIARLLECFACSAAAQLHAERSLRLAGAAAALRQNIGAPLTPAEQAKLEAALAPARQALTNTVGAAAWLEGWTLRVEKVVEEVLMPDAASPSS